MQFRSMIIAAAALAGITMATNNTITFVNQDSTKRTIYFSAAVGHKEFDPLPVPGNSAHTQAFPYQWNGNFFSISEGEPIVPGMLGEFTFNGWQGITFFDVSAIVNPNDTHGVKEIFPKNSNTPMSGCQTFPCDNCYNVWNDDWASLGTTETEFVVLIGDLDTAAKRSAMKRDETEVEKRSEVKMERFESDVEDAASKMKRVDPNGFIQ